MVITRSFIIACLIGSSTWAAKTIRADELAADTAPAARVEVAVEVAPGEAPAALEVVAPANAPAAVEVLAPADAPTDAEASPAAAAATGAESPIEAATGDSEATRVIAGLNDSLLAVLKHANDSDYAQRFAMLEPALQKHFDLEYMARRVVGRAFLDLSEQERVRWYQLFATYMTTNYASRFDHYSEQSFEIIGEESGAKDTVLVRTRVIDPADENVELSYRLRQMETGWKVVDVYLKGTVSELALRRAEYASVLKREGFAALSGKIQARIKEIEDGDTEG